MLCHTREGGYLVDLQDMTKDDTGLYHYFYTIADDAPYGRYETTVTAVDADGNVTKWVKDFYIFPWNCTSEIRSRSGVEEYKSISDDDLARIAWDAYEEVRNEIYELHDWEKFVSDPNLSGVMFNGTNTTVRVNVCDYDELADIDGDGTVAGWGEQSCGTDVDAYWIDSDYARHQACVTVVDEITGRCTVTQDDGSTAIPSTHNGVRVKYWTKHARWNERLMRKAVTLLASHEVVQRFHELDRATLADMESNKAVFLADPNRLMKLYKRTLDRVRGPMFGGTR